MTLIDPKHLNQIYRIVGSIGNNQYRSFLLDPIVHSLVELEQEHHEVHEGEHFFLSGYKDLNTAQTLALTITTPNTLQYMHMVWELTCNGPVTILLYEGAGSISGGSAATPRNNNRNSANTSNAVIKIDPTVGTPGTLIGSTKFGTVGPGAVQPIGGLSRRENELVLAQNTSYYMLATAADDNLAFNYVLRWYEHTTEN